MTQREWFLVFLDRLPTYDPRWSPEVTEKWFECFWHLWRWACRITVNEAIEAYIQRGTNEP